MTQEEKEPRNPQANLRDTLHSSSYILAEEDIALLKRDELRPVRLQLEYFKPELLLEKYKVRSTIVVFGGTRIVEENDARARVEALEAQVAEHPADGELARRLAVARRVLAKSHFYEEAREFGRLVSTSCQISDRRELVVVTGGGPGIMEAANRGAFEAGAKSIGLNITLPHEQEPNAYITPELCFQFHYFALRKLHFLQRARALVAFPGGYGTLDELFEALTLIQTGKSERIPLILVGREFWEKAIDFGAFAEEGTIDPTDLELFEYAETAREAWDLICRFYEMDPGHPLRSLQEADRSSK
jgi:uncharacterized protein (TIGR00730 family)